MMEKKAEEVFRVGGGIIEDGAARGREDFLTFSSINTDDEGGGAEGHSFGMTDANEIGFFPESFIASEHFRTLEEVVGRSGFNKVGKFKGGEFGESYHREVPNLVRRRFG